MSPQRYVYTVWALITGFLRGVNHNNNKNNRERSLFPFDTSGEGTGRKERRCAFHRKQAKEEVAHRSFSSSLLLLFLLLFATSVLFRPSTCSTASNLRRRRKAPTLKEEDRRNAKRRRGERSKQKRKRGTRWHCLSAFLSEPHPLSAREY